MKIKMITKKGATPCAEPDIANFTDDIMGADLSAEMPDDDIKMIRGKKKIIRMVQPKKTMEVELENEEENEEGELESEKMIKSSKPKKQKLSNHEQAISHGLNPDSTAKAKRFEHNKVVHAKDIARVMAKAIEAKEPISVTVHQVKSLPNEIKTPIIALSRQLFGPITNTPIGDISVVANIPRIGPNSQEEVTAVEHWLRMVGNQDHDLIAELQHKIHGLRMYKTDGITHLIVRNDSGHLIFSWPSLDNHIVESREHRIGLNQ